MEKTAELGLAGDFGGIVRRWREFTGFGVAVDNSVNLLIFSLICVILLST